MTLPNENVSGDVTARLAATDGVELVQRLQGRSCRFSVTPVVVDHGTGAPLDTQPRPAGAADADDAVLPQSADGRCELRSDRTIRGSRRSARATLTAVLVASAVFAPPARASESVRAFFPARPANVAMLSATGVLTGYGIGNGSGGIDVRDGRRLRSFYTAAHVKLDGHEISCDAAPQSGRPKSPFCTDWPRRVVIGTTRVRVAYWRVHRPGFAGLVDVTDRIDTL